MIYKQLLTFLLMAFLGTQAQAYTIFTLEEVNWNQVDEVDVFVAGYGPEMGGLFVYSAITNARYAQENSPRRRAQVIIWVQEKAASSHKRDIESRGFHIITNNSKLMTVNVLERYLMSYPKISSLHIFSHSNAWTGISLQADSTRLNEKTLDWGKLSSRFTNDSFIFLHGCNNGFEIAAKLSREVGRPVFGSLTGTDFQEIYSDKKWYHHNKGQFPSGMSKLTWNDVLFGKREACWKGFCYRMKPTNHPYTGSWGKYETGLPYYKPFCNYGANTRGSVTSDCLSGIANAVRSWPVDKRMTNEQRAVDFICPINPGHSSRNNCVNYLNGRSNQKIYWGNTLNCSLTGCEFTLANSTNRDGNSVKVFQSRDQGNAPFRQDYNLILRALNNY